MRGAKAKNIRRLVTKTWARRESIGTKSNSAFDQGLVALVESRTERRFLDGESERESDGKGNLLPRTELVTHQEADGLKSAARFVRRHGTDAVRRFKSVHPSGKAQGATA